MFKVDIPPETPAWRQEFSACENCLSLHCQVLAEALKRIYELGENTGSHVSWKAVYEQAQTIAQKALDGK